MDSSASSRTNTRGGPSPGVLLRQMGETVNYSQGGGAEAKVYSPAVDHLLFLETGQPACISAPNITGLNPSRL